MSDELIKVPAFLAEEARSGGVIPMCDFCTEVACETDAMICGQACGQSCSSQCAVSECTQCSACQTCETACELSTQIIYTAPTFTITNITDSGAIVNVRPGSGYTKYRVFARLTSDTSNVTYDWVFPTTSAFQAEMSGLAPRTSYTVNVCGVSDDVPGMWAGAQEFVTGAKNRPNYFSWLRGAGISKPRVNELAQEDGIPPYLTADGWNTYTANINAVRVYKGLSQYGFTEAIKGVTVLSAAMVNQAITAINDLSPPVSPPGKATSMVTSMSAALLNKLVDSLNSVP